MRIPFLRPKAPAAAERSRGSVPVDNPVSVEAARTRARRRLVGALVLLAIGVIGFPAIFETQPRPLPVETPIEVISRDVLAVAPVPKPSLQPQPLPAPPVDADSESATAVVSAVGQAASMPMPAPTAAESRAGASVAAGAPVAGSASAVAAAEAASAGPSRFVVQVGAYTDATMLREARAKVEKTGLKTYTQVIENDAGKRTRVRVGPFGTRREAESAAAKVRHAGLPANVIEL